MTYRHDRQQFPQRGGSPSSRMNFNRQTLSLPTDYLKNGYFDNNGNILPEVIIEWPRDIAKKLDIAGIGSAQIRNFFGEVRHIQGNKIREVFPDPLQGTEPPGVQHFEVPGGPLPGHVEAQCLEEALDSLLHFPGPAERLSEEVENARLRFVGEEHRAVYAVQVLLEDENGFHVFRLLQIDLPQVNPRPGMIRIEGIRFPVTTGGAVGIDPPRGGEHRG